MKLEQIYPDFTKLSDRDQLAFIRNYRNKRFMDLQSYAVHATHTPTKKRKTSVRKKKAVVPIDPKDMEALKKLGLSAKDIAKMRKK